MHSPSVSPKPLTGGKVLLMLVAFFGVVFGVNFTMANLAIKTLPGTEVDSAYSASLPATRTLGIGRSTPISSATRTVRRRCRSKRATKPASR
jgi:nitrogen fixation protein FixH